MAASILGAVVIAAQQPARTTADGVFTAEQAARGAAEFRQTCAACHGPALTGDDMTPALTGADFLRSWSGVALSELFERIRLGMPADAPGSLDRQQVADLVAYLLSANNAPPGVSELPAQAAPLKAIRMTGLR